ncbi:MAG TPA: hypothetical protein VGJ91_01265, partial [Polyangiaceae bacterium]
MLAVALAASLAIASGCGTVLDIGSVPEPEASSVSPDAGTPDSVPLAAAAGRTGSADDSTTGGASVGAGVAGAAGVDSAAAAGAGPAGPSCDLSQCQALLAAAAAVPSDCAIATCDPVSDSCVFTARDADGDGHRAASCAATGLEINGGDDCDDSDPMVYPTKTAVCSETAAGKSVSFPGGSPKGTCSLGTKVCQADGKFGACTGVIAPATTDCTSANDKDCDGKADNTECGVCTAGQTAACYDGPSGSQGVGRCRAGTHTCVLNGSSTSWGSCTGQI